MKHIVLSIVVLVAACSLCSIVAYRAGYAWAKQLQKGTFVVSLDALQKLRAADFEQATRKMEALCFSSADMLYGDPAYRDQMVTRTFAHELIQYRASYRTNRAEWTPAEEQLEKHLARWR